MRRIITKTIVSDAETGEIIRTSVNRGTQNGDDWVIVYRASFMDFLLTAPDFTTAKVFGSLMTKQEFENGVRSTKKAIADELNVSYRSVIAAFNWLKENGYVKERKVNGQTEFLLNPNVTTCGRNKSKKVALWNSI